MLRDELHQLIMLYLGPPAYVLVFVALFVVAPIALFTGFLLLLVRGRWGASRDGLAMGLAVSVWASACWLLDSYLGVFANLPSSLIVTAIFGWPQDAEPSWPQELLVVAMNFLVWPIAGWLCFHAFERMAGPSPDAACEP